MDSGSLSGVSYPTGRIVVIGASAAGIFAAEGLRRAGYDGDIVILGDEKPYDRPPLSKQVLAGDWSPDQAILLPAPRLEAINAKLQIGVRCTAIDVAARTVCTSEGESLRYDAAIIATGVRPRVLPGFDLPGVFTLRTVSDSLALRAAILDHKRLIVVGAGFIGLEVAASALRLGADVTVVEIASAPLTPRLGAVANDKLLARHRAEGVDLRLGAQIAGVSKAADGSVAGLRLGDGSELHAPAILVAAGCVPNTECFADPAITIDNGIVCDAFCLAAPHVWAAGDVARWFHTDYGRHMRIEHRMNASEQGNAVARNIMGAAAPYLHMPFFWSDQYDIKLQLAGVVTPQSEVAVEYGDVASDSFLQTFRENGRLTGILSWNAAKALTQFRRELIETTAAARAAQAATNPVLA